MLVLLKAPLLCFYLLFFLLADSFLRLTLGLAHPPTFRTLRSAWARGLLFVLGFPQVSITYDGRKRKPIQRDDLVVSNWSSPVDILLLVYLIPDALFVQCTDASEMLYKTRSALDMGIDALSMPTLTHRSKGQSLAELRRVYKDRVLVLFPEATPTNNRGLLAFQPVIADEAYVVGIRYGTPACLTSPIPNTVKFLWACFSVLRHEVRLKVSAGPVLQADWEETMARCARISRTRLAVADKLAFLDAWERR
ncbi:hypothetical protein BCR37DRAFT_389521 [Protomyces lactucae-debilis]|uniref:Phospholipid/glycerol acyltransferase domain-containing protein n=1 Tax=Protomyces lactucae-debilis TaxID=2754530 RepID=A0A1Y2EWX9_PROLT|nr:uncharacterized protein BCR37DRAFT_389521 [Protomyces lactucae-debilis]ORY76060.1 hypothetical protein BCR37DRAFT_389521 [Protomyces lactucae-debilis]